MNLGGEIYKLQEGVSWICDLTATFWDQTHAGFRRASKGAAGESNEPKKLIGVADIGYQL